MAITFLALWGNGIRITDPSEADASVVMVRPWGFEIRVDLTDGATIYNEVFTYAQMPTKAKVRGDVLAKIAQIEAQLAYVPPTKNITCQDGTVVVVLESDCPVNVNLEVTLTTNQSNAWGLIRPLLKTYLSRIMSVYRRLPDDKRRELREHCTILDLSLTMMEE
jgi:hypothetical protein